MTMSKLSRINSPLGPGAHFAAQCFGLPFRQEHSDTPKRETWKEVIKLLLVDCCGMMFFHYDNLALFLKHRGIMGMSHGDTPAFQAMTC